MLTAADMPGYTQDPPGRRVKSSPEFTAAADACVNNNPVIAALRSDNDPHGAHSPDFRRGQPVTVSSSVTFAETEDHARTALADIGAASFPECFSRALTPEVRSVPTNSNVSVTTAALPVTGGDQSLGYRVVAKYRTEGTNVIANLDFIFVRVGRAVASIDNVWTAAFPVVERVRLVTLIAGRMAAP